MDEQLLKLLMGNSRKTTTNKAQNMFIAPKKEQSSTFSTLYQKCTTSN